MATKHIAEGVDLTGNIQMNSNKITGIADGTEANDVVNKNQLDSAIQGLDWQGSVLDKDLSAPPGSPGTGDRYIVGTGATGAWAGKDNQIAEWNGTAWDFTVQNEGFACWVEDEDKQYTWNGAGWITFGSTTTHNNLSGIQGGITDEYYHLTNAQHSDLTDSGDCGIHKHDDIYYSETELDAGQLDSRYYTETELDAGQLDNRYFTEAEHIDSSAGVGDAGKPVKLAASGLVDDTMLTTKVAKAGDTMTGDLEITDNTKGVILRSATKRWRLSVDENGVISTTQVV